MTPTTPTPESELVARLLDRALHRGCRDDGMYTEDDRALDRTVAATIERLASAHGAGYPWLPCPICNGVELTPSDLPDTLAEIDKPHDQLLPDRLNGMDTAPGITDEEMREILRIELLKLDLGYQANRNLEWAVKPSKPEEWNTEVRTLIAALAAMRAVASRTRPATSEPDAMAESEALRRLLQTAKLLLQNSEGCAINHYGEDIELHGLPGWLSDCKADIDRASAFIARHTGEK